MKSTVCYSRISGIAASRMEWNNEYENKLEAINLIQLTLTLCAH